MPVLHLCIMSNMSDELFYKKIENFFTILERFEKMENGDVEGQRNIADLLGTVVVHKWMEMFGKKAPKKWYTYMNEIDTLKNAYNRNYCVDMAEHSEYIRNFSDSDETTTWKWNYIDDLTEEMSPETAMYLEVIEPHISYGYGDADDYMEELKEYLTDMYETEEPDIYCNLICNMQDNVVYIWDEVESSLESFSNISEDEQQKIYTLALLEATYGSEEECDKYLSLSNPVLKKYFSFSKENPELIKEKFLMEHFYIEQLFEQMGKTSFWEHLIKYSWDDAAIFCSYNYKSSSSCKGNSRGNSIFLSFFAFLIDWLLQKADKKFPDAWLFGKKKEESV